MSLVGGVSSELENGVSFWKKNLKIVPGRPSPTRSSAGVLQQKSSVCVFEDFQDSVKDAWDVGDNEFCIASDVKIFKKISESAALNVISVHRSSHDGESSAGSLPISQQRSRVPERKNKIASQQRNVHESHPPNNASFQEMPTLHVTHKQCLKTLEPSTEHPEESRSTNYAQFECIEGKLKRFQHVLENPQLDLEKLKNLSWSGVPNKYRAVTWRFLSGYLPTKLERREVVLERNRQEYQRLVKQCYNKEEENAHWETYRQIQKDIPRMSPLMALFRQRTVQDMFERILFVWAIRHPASGYVQGINDLVTPFFVVFLQYLLPPNEDLNNFEVSSLPKEQLDMVEADSFWCFSKFLDGFQDNYIFAQQGIQHKVNRLKDLIQRVDGSLHCHLQENGIDYLLFSFRWMNNLLTRELPLHCTIRLWDTYLAESEEFPSFQLYVFAAFLLHWRKQLLIEKDFQGLMLMLQNLPTHNWSNSEIDLLVAEAYRLKVIFAGAQSHLNISR